MREKTIELRKMTREEFANYLGLSLEQYAQDGARNFRRPIEKERSAAREQVHMLLKNGIDTQGHFFFNVLDKETATAIGSLWFHVDEARNHAFLYDIRVHDSHRRMGYGRQIMKSLEEKLRGMGVRSIGLHVFADNTAAMNLYKTQGYYVASLNMQRDL